MGQVLHGCATTTHTIRAAIQRSKASIQELSKTYNLNPKTVAKWKKRDFVDDVGMGPKNVRSTVLSTIEEAIIMAFRKHTLLPLDDCLYALQTSIPHLSRSSLHRCLQRHGISRLPNTGGRKPKKKFRDYPIGYFHIDIAEVRTAEGKLYLFVAIDRTSKVTFVELHEKATRRIAADFLKHVIEAVPYRINIVLTDNGTHFTTPGGGRSMAGELMAMKEAGELFRAHAFEWMCAQNNIEHRLTKPNHPWTNGQVERMNRTLKEATVRRYHYENHDQLREHLSHFVLAYNHARRLKVLKGLTPHEFICKCWTNEPERFKLNPSHYTLGLNT